MSNLFVYFSVHPIHALQGKCISNQQIDFNAAASKLLVHALAMIPAACLVPTWSQTWDLSTLEGNIVIPPPGCWGAREGPLSGLVVGLHLWAQMDILASFYVSAQLCHFFPSVWVISQDPYSQILALLKDLAFKKACSRER